MKKLFALLFVCAGLTAMAAQPMQIKTAKKTVKDASSLVMKQNKFQKAGNMNLMTSNNKMSLNQFMHNRSISDNALNRRAPLRIDSTAMVGNYVYSNFMYNMVDGTVQEGQTPFVMGRDVEVTLDQTNADYNVGYLNIYPFPALFDLGDGKGPVYYLDMLVYADFANEYVLLEGGITGNNYTWIDREEISAPRQQVGYKYTFLDWGVADLAYMMGQSDTIANYIDGQISDGAIIIPDGFGVVYQKSYYNVYFNATTGALVDMQFVSEDEMYKGNELYLDTYILPANGTHEYTQINRSSNTLGNSYVFTREDPDTNYVYMYQVDDSIFVWNMWNMGMYDNQIVLLDEEGLAGMPFQMVHNEDMTEIREYYGDDSSDEFYNFYSLYDLDVDTIIGQAPMGWATPMQVTEDRTGIEWNSSGIFDLYTENGDTLASVGYRFILNKLSFNDGTVIELPAPVEPEFELGDVDHSGGVDIVDVTILINAVLGNETDIFYPENANCNGEGAIDIEDVTALINRVLSGSWE